MNTQNGLQANYTYNFMGQRVRKSITGSQNSDSRYFYGPQGELLGEYDALGNRVYEYIYRPDTDYPELIAVVNATGEVLYVHTDHLMTPRQVTDNSQTVVWQWLSEAFGQTLANEDPDGDSQTVTLTHRFPGQHFDSESGLHYNYFRYYNPGTGRYITSDPIGLKGGNNTYIYSKATPLKFYDPYGLYCLTPSEINAIAGAFGGLFSGAASGSVFGGFGAAAIGGLGAVVGGVVGYFGTDSNGNQMASGAANAVATASGSPLSAAFGGAFGGSMSNYMQSKGISDTQAGMVGGAVGGAVGSANASIFSSSAPYTVSGTISYALRNAWKGGLAGLSGAALSAAIAEALRQFNDCEEECS